MISSRPRRREKNEAHLITIQCGLFELLPPKYHDIVPSPSPSLTSQFATSSHSLSPIFVVFLSKRDRHALHGSMGYQTKAQLRSRGSKCGNHSSTIPHTSPTSTPRERQETGETWRSVGWYEFGGNVSGMKKLAARDFEDILQVRGIFSARAIHSVVNISYNF